MVNLDFSWEVPENKPGPGMVIAREFDFTIKGYGTARINAIEAYRYDLAHFGRKVSTWEGLSERMAKAATRLKTARETIGTAWEGSAADAVETSLSMREAEMVKMAANFDLMASGASCLVKALTEYQSKYYYNPKVKAVMR